MSSGTADSELKARHRAMWASGDYPAWRTALLPLRPRLDRGVRHRPGNERPRRRGRTGNASIPPRGSATTGHDDLTPELLDAAPPCRSAERSTFTWPRPTPRACPSRTESFDVVISSIGAMFAPTTRTSPTSWSGSAGPVDHAIGILNWTPEGTIDGTVPDDGTVRAPAAAGAQPPPLWGARSTSRRSCSETASTFRTLDVRLLEVTAFEHPLRRALPDEVRADDRRAQRFASARLERSRDG